MSTHTTTAHKPNSQILALNAVRGLAALIVVFSHMPELTGLYFGPIHQGSLGVMVFFTLSGFLMGYLYLGQPTTLHNVAAYSIARFSRIAPPYLIVVLLAVAIYTLADPKFPYAIGGHNFLRHFLFSGNVSVFWSIPPEVQFYALFILFWWAVQRAVNGRAGMLLGVLALAIVALCVRDKVPGTFAISKLHYFLLGSILGGLHPWLRKVPIGVRSLTVLQLLLIATFGLFLLRVVQFPQNYWHDLTPALIAGLVVFAFAHDRTPIDAAFAAKPLQWLGDWSFSIYLVHVPIVYWLERAGLLENHLMGLAGVLFTLAVCGVFSVFIERPACAATKRRMTAWLRSAENRWARRRPEASPETRVDASPSPRLVPEIAPDIATTDHRTT